MLSIVTFNINGGKKLLDSFFKTNIKNKSIGICIWSVLNKKQVKINGFTCKNKKELKNKKNNKRDRERLYKTTKNKLSFYKK